MFSNLLVWATLALSAAALSTPHVARNSHLHRAVGMRQPEPELVVRAPAPKLRKRCQARPPPSPLSSTAVVPSASAVAAANAGSDPDSPPSVAAAPPAYTPSSTYVAPPAYTPSSTYVAPPAASSPSSSGGSSGSSLFSGSESGDGTYYATGLGACGITNSDTDFIAAISHLTFDTYPGYDGTNPNNNPICGKTVTAYYEGNQVTVAIVDRCAGCDLPSSLDFSPSAFSGLANQDLGRIQINWTWN